MAGPIIEHATQEEGKAASRFKDRRRYALIEARLLQTVTEPPSAKALDLVFRRLAYAERLYFRSLKELRRAQKERLARAQEEEAESSIRAANVSERSEDSLDEIGFVPPVSPTSQRTEAPRRL